MTTFRTSEFMRSMTLTVTIKDDMGWRLWVAKKLFAAGAWVLKCNIEIVSESKR